MRTLSSVLVCAVSVVGCGSSGMGVDGGMTADGGAGFTAQEVQAVFTTSCSSGGSFGCHVGVDSPANGMSLDDFVTNGLVIDVDAMEATGSEGTLKRIDPGQAREDSYLWRKINGGPDITGSRMPFTGPPYLDDETIDKIGLYIESL